jgi:putative ABC transport system permease protein
MRLSNIVRLYRVRLRSRIVQELFAVLGIAVGVALLFASQVASTSLNGAVRQLTAGIVGQMRFQITARDTHGFDASLLGEVRRIPGVRGAVPVLQENANVVGPDGSQSIDLVGVDPRLAYLGGGLVRKLDASQLARTKVFMLPTPIAQRIGASSLQPVKLDIGARKVSALLVPELLTGDSGILSESPIGIAPLRYVQRLTGMTGRLTSIYVQSQPGRDREVRAQLTQLAAGRLNVRPADFTLTLFRKAAQPTNQSTSLFSTISALVGFLFAFNALLLTVPQRRDLIEDLRLDGYTRKMIIEVLLCDALALGFVASMLGLALGELLSVELFRLDPGYLSFAFPIGSQRVVTWQSIAVAMVGGTLAACIGVLAPLRRGLFSPLSLAFPSSNRVIHGRVTVLLAGGVVCLIATTIVLLAALQAAIVGVVTLIAALLLLLSGLLDVVLAVFDRLQRPIRGAATYLAVIELRSSSNRSRSVAIAATGAIAVFGSVAIESAHSNLQGGLDDASHDVNAVADVWVSPAGSSNLLATTPFPTTMMRTLASLPDVRRIRIYRGGFLDYDDRRIWVIAPSREAEQPIPPSQLVHGDLALATARFRAGGWAVVSQAVADDHHMHIGQSFTLPAPRPTAFRVAALSTNIGWPPGAIILNADDYARAWASADPSAYNITLARRVSPVHARHEIQRALGPVSGLVVETRRQREQRGHVTSRQGLSRLTQISVLVLIAGVLAMAAAMGAMIWQRRPRLAEMKVDGFDRAVLWRALLLESSILLGTGCLIGAVFGVYAQLLLSQALADVTGFPVVSSLGILIPLGSFALVTAVAVLIVAVPGHLAVRVRPSISLRD